MVNRQRRRWKPWKLTETGEKALASTSPGMKVGSKLNHIDEIPRGPAWWLCWWQAQRGPWWSLCRAVAAARRPRMLVSTVRSSLETPRGIGGLSKKLSFCVSRCIPVDQGAVGYNCNATPLETPGE